MTEEEIKPKRRSRKTATPEEEAAAILQENGISTDAIAEETPAKKPRASKKTAAVETEAAATADAPVETEKPKRSRAKKAAVEAEPVVEVIEVIETGEGVEIIDVIEIDEAGDVVEVIEIVETAEPVHFIDSSSNNDEHYDERDEARAAAAAPARDSDTLTFSDLGLSDAILKSVKDVGYEEPTPIQAITIPAMLRGGDIIAQAQTGSGKTAAFGLPIIDTVDARDRSVQALILTPTRELAIQVAEALHKYGKHKGIETLPIYGGQPYERQFRGLQRGPQIVVGTPGRVMDHMRRNTLVARIARVLRARRSR